MGKIIRLTENDLSKLIRRVISEGAKEEVDTTVTKNINKNVSINSVLNFEKAGDQTVSVSTKQNPNSKMTFKIDFAGKPYKIVKLNPEGCNSATGTSPKVTINLKNKDFPLTWGVYRNLPGSGKGNGGFVFPNNSPASKAVPMENVKTNFLSQIDYEFYGYKDKNDVNLQLWFCVDNEKLWEIFKDLQKTGYQTATKGIPNVESLSAEIKRTA